MKKISLYALMSALCVLMLASAASSQTVEVYGGFTQSRWKATTNATSFNPNGFTVEGEVFLPKVPLLPHLSVVGQVSRGDQDKNIGAASINTALTTIKIGPRLSQSLFRVRLFEHVLLGAAHLNNEIKSNSIGVYNASVNNFAMAAGGGVELKATRHISIRPAQIEYLYTRNGGNNQNYFRYGCGVAVHF